MYYICLRFLFFNVFTVQGKLSPDKVNNKKCFDKIVEYLDWVHLGRNLYTLCVHLNWNFHTCVHLILYNIRLERKYWTTWLKLLKWHSLIWQLQHAGMIFVSRIQMQPAECILTWKAPCSAAAAVSVEHCLQIDVASLPAAGALASIHVCSKAEHYKETHKHVGPHTLHIDCTLQKMYVH